MLHVDLVTGAVRRLLLSPDGDQPAGRASNWWSSKEQQVRGVVSMTPMINFVQILRITDQNNTFIEHVVCFISAGKL